MLESFFNNLLKIRELESKDRLSGFNSLFSDIHKMSIGELIATKQTIDLGLKLSTEMLDTEQETFLVHVVQAMRIRAYEHSHSQLISPEQRWFLKRMFCIAHNQILDLRYDHTRRVLLNDPTPALEIPITTPPKKRKKRYFWFF
ncbi:MAG: hypothetical protein US70_C0007G0040 [Parcubacteria group bacterium GW2011_GWD2_38_11]|nr:MAG: hypothetical protein US70_C0007G0040 [Parcubacteria group bacterium GW2011_GWD2_38_11]